MSVPGVLPIGLALLAQAVPTDLEPPVRQPRTGRHPGGRGAGLRRVRAVLTLAILKGIAIFVPLRRESREEGIGLDIVQHGEERCARGEGAVQVLPDATPARGKRIGGAVLSPLSSTSHP